MIQLSSSQCTLPGAVCTVTSPPTCAAGQWRNGAVCTTCVAGEYCPDTISRFYAEIGTYAAAASTSFTECPITSSCTVGAASNCGNGAYSSVGGMTCSVQPPHTYKSNDFNAGTPDGSYNNGAQTGIAGGLGGNWCPGLTGVDMTCPDGYFCTGSCAIDFLPVYLSAAADPLDPSGLTELFGEYSHPGDPNVYPTD